MAGKKREEITEKDITGLKYFDKLVPLLERLHDVGCERDKAGNRTLFFNNLTTRESCEPQRRRRSQLVPCPTPPLGHVRS